ncbi:MAG: FAD-dependent oxidoreductase [Candidatus Lokiarchaeota archaeon]|nr:FAD-dependent oxidoreductase [Candidatus Lokiarchaeota archaeon]
MEIDSKIRKIAIIGNGIAGNSAAEAIRTIDRNVEVVMVSDETFPLYSACVLPHYLAEEIKDDVLFLKGFGDYLDNKIEILLNNRVNNIDVRFKKIDFEGKSKSLIYDKLILATGSNPIIPLIKGNDLHGVFCLKTLEDAKKMDKYKAKSVVIVGSGLVGVETAVAFKKKGYNVYLIELLPRIMPKNFNSVPSRIIQNILEEHGIKVFTQEKIVEILGENCVKEVVTDRRTVKCEMVIFAIGMKPNIHLAQKSGIEIGASGGIKTDDQMRTNIESVYACGDCVETLDLISGNYTLNLLWGFAQKQGEIAGNNCLGGSKIYYAQLPRVAAKLFDIPIVSLGCIGDENTTTKQIIKTKQADSYSEIVIEDNVIVGVQMIGRVENSGIFSTIIENKYRLEDIRSLIYHKNILFANPWYYKLKRLLN